MQPILTIVQMLGLFGSLDFLRLKSILGFKASYDMLDRTLPDLVRIKTHSYGAFCPDPLRTA